MVARSSTLTEEMHMADGAEINLKLNGPILVSGEFTLSD
jgi:hypothetical protein